MTVVTLQTAYVSENNAFDRVFEQLMFEFRHIDEELAGMTLAARVAIR